MTTLYFSGQATDQLEAVRRWPWETRPLAVLVSFSYMRVWDAVAPYFRCPRSLMLDSGAFTAFTTGKTVDHDALLAEATKTKWTEAIGLDVIGDWQASKANADREFNLGLTKMIPTFHLGDPWELLDHYKAKASKIGIGGMVGVKKQLVTRFLEQVFARAWPHRLHSFGRTEPDILLSFPFESADSATWIVAPARYRNWIFKSGGRQLQRHLSVDGTPRNKSYGTMSHMESMWRREQQLIAKWESMLKPLKEIACPTPPTT